MKEYVQSFSDFLNESEARPVELNVTEINTLLKNNKKVWVLTGGAPGSGKSYVAKKYISLPIIDMDDYVERLSGGKGKYNQKFGSKARVLARKDVDKNFATGQSFLKQGVSAGFKAVENQCKQAKEAGFVTVFLYIDISTDQAKANNLKRVKSGERESSVSDYVIDRKWKDSKEVFNQIKKTPGLFDYYVYHFNKI